MIIEPQVDMITICQFPLCNLLPRQHQLMAKWGRCSVPFAQLMYSTSEICTDNPAVSRLRAKQANKRSLVFLFASKPELAFHSASRDYAREVRIAGGGNLFAHIAEGLRAKRRADVWPAGLARRNAAVPLSDAVSRAEATAGDLDAELEVWC